MHAEKVKVVAAELLKIGTSKIWINPEEMDRIKEAMTKDDVRALIKDGIVKKRKGLEQSKGRARELHAKKKKKRRKGLGSRKGTKKARRQRKKEWMSNIRSQRAKLQEMKKEAKEKGVYANAYKRINGNFFKGKKHLEKFIKGEK